MEKDFREFIGSLNAAGAKYVVVGGYAVGFHGFMRYTEDIDFFVEASPENAARVMLAMRTFGAPTANIAERDFSSPNMVVQFGRPPNRIDILTSLEGVRFEDAWKKRVEVTIDGLRVPFMGLNHLLRNKRAVGRPQDLTDVKRIIKHNRPSKRRERS